MSGAVLAAVIMAGGAVLAASVHAASRVAAQVIQALARLLVARAARRGGRRDR